MGFRRVPALFFGLLLWPALLQGASGDLDPSFDPSENDGIVFIPVNAQADIFSDLLLQPDGGIVVLGRTDVDLGLTDDFEFGLARLNGDGSLDADFGSGGKVTTPGPPASNDQTSALALQADGKIVAAGSSDVNPGMPFDGDFAIHRYLPDGSLDDSFGGDGVVLTPITGQFESVSAVTIRPDGGIIAVGAADGDPGADVVFNVVLALYTGEGDLDDTFGTDGIALIPNPTEERPNGMVLQTDGKIVVVGTIDVDATATNDLDFVVLRFLTDGTPDPDFGSGGRVILPAGTGFALLNDVVLQPDGKIVVVGEADVAAGPDFDFDTFVMRLNEDGGLDPDFGSAGETVLPLTSGNSESSSRVALDGAGRIIVAGNTNDFSGPSDPHVFAARLSPDGSADPAFGVAGVVQTPLIGSVHEGARIGLALQPDGKIVVGADTFQGGFDWAVLRYLGDSAGLSLSKTAGSATATAGSQVTYSIAIANDGPDAASGVVMTDALPGGATFVSATPSQGSCSGTTNVVCKLGTLSAGGGATVSLVVTANAEGSLVNTAEVSAEAVETDPADNAASATVTVSAAGGTGGDDDDDGGGGCALMRGTRRPTGSE